MFMVDKVYKNFFLGSFIHYFQSHCYLCALLEIQTVALPELLTLEANYSWPPIQVLTACPCLRKQMICVFLFSVSAVQCNDFPNHIALS